MEETLRNFNINKLSKIIPLLDNITSIGIQGLKELQHKQLHISTNVYANYFQRFICCYESSSMLLKKFLIDQYHVEYPISILLRASLLDSLTLLYLRSYYEELPDGLKSEPNYNTEFCKLLTSQIRRVLTLTNEEKNSKYFNLESYKKSINLTIENFPYLFKASQNINYSDPCSSLIYGKQNDELKTSKILKRLKNCYNYKEHNYPHIYNLYDLYSKHDHFGMMSMILQKMDINEVFDNFIWSLYYIRDSIVLCLEFLHHEGNFKVEYKELNLMCGDLGGVIISEEK